MNAHLSTFRQLLSAVVIAALAVGGSGCTQLGLTSWLKGERMVRADAKHPVDEVICIWEVAEGRGLDGMPCRGFAGQLLFFSGGISEPIAGNGDVMVYVFDDQGAESSQAKPLHQFDFPAVAWNAFLREANIGPGYQIFIPYTRKGSHQAECALRVRYTPVDGGATVYSKMVSVVLSGSRPVVKAGSGERPATTVSQQFPGAIPNAADHGALTLDGLGGRPDYSSARIETAARNLANSLQETPQLPLIHSDKTLPLPLKSTVVDDVAAQLQSISDDADPVEDQPSPRYRLNQ